MPPRRTDLPFPAYTYVPGKNPHPIRDPAGHSHGQPEPHVTEFDTANSQHCEPFEFGIDLFNAGFYWEAHEQWEAVWHAAGRQGMVADFLKGLIKLAAAGVKLREGRPVGVQRHATRACELFSIVANERAELCGFQLATLMQWSQQVASQSAEMRGEDLGFRL